MKNFRNRYVIIVRVIEKNSLNLKNEMSKDQSTVVIGVQFSVLFIQFCRTIKFLNYLNNQLKEYTPTEYFVHPAIYLPIILLVC